MTRARITMLAAVAGTGILGVLSVNHWWVRAELANQELAARVSTLEAAPKPRTKVIERTRVIEREREPPRHDDGVAVEVDESAGPLSDADLGAALVQEFAVEPVDPGWARQATGEFLPGIQKFMPASSRLESFECRSRFCELVVVHENVDVSNDFLQRLFALDGPLGRTSGGFRASEPTTTADGKVSFHVYVARPGATLAVDATHQPPESGSPDG